MDAGQKKSKTPKFSIIVPIYNVEAFLRETIDSALSQTFRDYEIVLVNDGSTDSSGVICRQYRERFSDLVTIVDQENKGLLEARKSGIRAARGEYVVSLDGDDKLAPKMLEIMEDELRRNPVDVLAFRCCCNEAFEIDNMSAPHSLAVDDKDENLLQVAREALLATDSINGIWLKCIKRDCLMSYAASEERRVLMAEDKIATAYALDRAKSYRQLKDVLYFYRPNTMSITRQSFTRERFGDLCTAHEVLFCFAEKWKMKENIPSLHTLFLLQTCMQITALYSSCFSSVQCQLEADFMRNNRAFTEVIEARGQKGLSLHKRLLVWLFRNRNPLLRPYLVLYNHGIAFARRERA